jgi:hypothetical protein
MGLALVVDLRVEHLVREISSGFRLEVEVRPGGVDDVIVLVGSRRGRDLQRSRVPGSRGRGRDPQP